MTFEEAHTTIVEAIEGIIPDESRRRGRFKLYDGEPVKDRTPDRFFRFDAYTYDEAPSDGRMGCEERQVEMRLSVFYTYTKEAQFDACEDAELLLNAIRGTIGAGITNIVPISTDFDHESEPGVLLANRNMLLVFSRLA